MGYDDFKGGGVTLFPYYDLGGGGSGKFPTKIGKSLKVILRGVFVFGS